MASVKDFNHKLRSGYAGQLAVDEIARQAVTSFAGRLDKARKEDEAEFVQKLQGIKEKYAADEARKELLTAALDKLEELGYSDGVRILREVLHG